jgi:hypothetical protein
MKKEINELNSELLTILRERFDRELGEGTINVYVYDREHEITCTLDDYLISGLMAKGIAYKIDFAIRSERPRNSFTLFNASFNTDYTSRDTIRILEFHINKDLRGIKCSYIAFKYLVLLLKKLYVKRIVDLRGVENSKHRGLLDKLGFRTEQIGDVFLSVYNLQE